MTPVRTTFVSAVFAVRSRTLRRRNLLASMAAAYEIESVTARNLTPMLDPITIRPH